MGSNPAAPTINLFHLQSDLPATRSGNPHIFNGDPNFAQSAVEALGSLQKSNILIINTIIFSEVAFNFDSAEGLIQILGSLSIEIREIPLQAAFEVSRVFKRYRKTKPPKTARCRIFTLALMRNFYPHQLLQGMWTGTKPIIQR